MSLLTFIRQKSVEKGIKICPHCGKEDIFYALNGKCLECGQQINTNSKISSLLYSIEVFTEYIDKYDELHSFEEKKNILQFLRGLIYTLQTKNSVDNSKILTLQSLVCGIGRIGGERIGGAITVSNASPSLGLLDDFSDNSNDPMERVKSLSAVILSIQYILAYPVKNEYILDTTKTIRQTPLVNTSTKSNGGCISVLLFLTVAVVMSIFIVINN